MQKAILFSALAGSLLSLPLAAQTATPCDPTVIPVTWTDCNGIMQTSPAQLCGLGPPAIGSEAGAYDVIPDPTTPGQYLIALTAKFTGAQGWDCVTGLWKGPGTTIALDGPNGTLYTGALNGPGDEFQFGLSRDGLVGVTDTGPGHPVGGGNAVIADRANVTSVFGNVKAISGIAGGYIDPTLGRINGKDVLFWISAFSDIDVGDIDTNSASPTFGQVTNVRVAVIFDPIKHPGSVSWHSPESVPDSTGETLGMVLSSQNSGSGSDFYWASTVNEGAFTSGLNVTPQLIHDDAGDWNANPADVGGTIIGADHNGTYADPIRIDYLAINSANVSTATGGTATFAMQAPAWNFGVGALLAAVNFGTPTTPPLVLTGLVPGVTGTLCVNPLASANGAFINGQFRVSFAVRPGLPLGAALAVQGAMLDTGNGTASISNMAWLQITQ